VSKNPFDFCPDGLFSTPTMPGSPLFDMSIRLEGRGAWPVLDTFVHRWQVHPARSGAPLRGASIPIPLPAGEPLAVQLTHTYGEGCPYPVPVQTARTALANGIRSARQFFYIEDQYFAGSAQMSAALTAALTNHRELIGIIVTSADSVSELPDLSFRRRAFLAPNRGRIPGPISDLRTNRTRLAERTDSLCAFETFDRRRRSGICRIGECDSAVLVSR
jgi:hypothetical protein